MTDLKATLRSDLTDAIRARDQLRSGTLRMTLAAIGNAEVAGTESRTLSDDEVLTVITKEAKKRREAALAFDGADRSELADKERAELAVLETYLPKQLSDEELDALAAEGVLEAGASGMAQMGDVMKVVQPKVAGRAEGGRVAAAVRRALSA
ncbi:GatB/YqeY domain-containing protein [Luteipulveratus sp. YIM 133132]|uniref:GatB/YqeY domain-containing protein n=1 Tax=Luteipulveratus flavus TaxID=3031728 RepID=A0ABT6C923_9MICO|nr:MULTISPECIES: GatB/YqeY domain-containing protein [unclassified Luteipulveratus]MDE9365734.1 GatB/YqeY domain-containing protein [Luteipulveratus sp. YIM 133132]MDF8264827.1 GatB/YqeY domain-containing protein [Luteipulveratus sp. YIM 133296]